LRATQARLSRAAQLATVAELSASIAHEINQPLGAVVANGDACEMWLSSDPPNLDRARLAVQRIVRDGNAAAEVIHRIRALFKQALPNKVVLDMNDVILEVIRLASNEIQRKKIRIETDLALNLPVTSADRVQMQQLMINLVQNAIESMETVVDRPKLLTLRSKRSDAETILIEVCDHGSGLGNADRVFEPFFTTKEKGMGMGLSISRSIVDAHEGSLWATQNEDQGTTFSFTIPVLTEKL
jgi:C4-dicarboxylate-specific signal transduction histidine kinase